MIHRLLQQIHSNHPTMSGLLMTCLIELFPNILIEDSQIIGGYVQQLLMVIQYIPELRPQILQLIIEKMILIDVEIEKRERNNEENNNQQNESSNNRINIHEIKDPNNDNDTDLVSDDDDSVISDQREDEQDEMAVSDNEEEDILTTNLDQLMCLMFDYIKIIADDDNKLLNQLFQTFSRIFETSILSTHEVKYLF